MLKRGPHGQQTNEVRPLSRWTARIAGAVLVALVALSGVFPGVGLSSTVIPAGGALRVHVVEGQGLPLAGARVELSAPQVGLAASAVTGADGMAVLSPGAGVSGLWLRVWAAGYGVVEREWDVAAVGRTVTVAVPALRGSLSGQVLDPTGLPVPGAVVTAWLPDAGRMGQAQSGPDGAFELRYLRPGEYALQVEAAGFQPYAATVPVSAGQNAHHAATLTPAAGSVAGTVVDARSGRPINGAMVELVRVGWGVIARATTGGGGGRFNLTVPPAAAAEYTLRVTAADYALLESQPFALPAGSLQEFSGERRLAMAPLFGSVWGFVLKPDGRPVAGAALELQLQGAGTVATARTDDDGYFSFEGVLPGTYRVRAFPGQYWAASDSQWLTVAAGEQHTLRINPVPYTKQSFGLGVVAGAVSAGAAHPVANAMVTLLRGDQVIATTTTDDWGRYRFTQVPGSAGLSRNVPVTTTGYLVRVEADGYLPTDQPAGGPEGELTVREEELVEMNFHLRSNQLGVAGRILDERGQPLPGARVSLYREGVAEPVAQVTATAGGHYRFPAQSLPGAVNHYVTAEGDGFYAATPSPLLQAEAAPGGYLETNLTLRPAAARLLGRVVDAHGAGVAGAQATVLRPADGRSWQVVADDNGWFSVDGLAAGPADRYLVRATAAGAPPAGTLEAVVPAGNRGVSTRLKLAPAAGIAGVVVDHRGDPVPGAAVELRREGEVGPVDRTVTDGDGRYRFTGLAAGEQYGVLARADGFIDSGQAPGDRGLTPLADARPGETVRYDVVLMPLR